MMKNPDCEIIRDLMPLCLDGEASEQKVIYRHGESLPLASEELDAYMQVYDEYKGAREALWEQEMADLAEDERQRVQRLTETEISQEKREAIEDTIPEWQ